MDLQNPEKKMSTTGGSEQGTVYVLDEPDAIIKKFKSAVTDSGREIRHSAGQGRDQQPARDPGAWSADLDRAARAGVRGLGYGDFKLAVGEAVVDYLAPVRERYDALRADEPGARGDAARRRREGASDRGRHDARRAQRDGRRPGRRPV